MSDLHLSNLGLLGLTLSHSVLGAPHAPRQADLDEFLNTQEPIAVQGVLANIGSSGSKVSGAADGIVVASPSKSDPDCEFPL